MPSRALCQKTDDLWWPSHPIHSHVDLNQLKRPLASSPFNLLNSMIVWSKWSVDTYEWRNQCYGATFILLILFPCSYCRSRTLPSDLGSIVGSDLWFGVKPSFIYLIVITWCWEPGIVLAEDAMPILIDEVHLGALLTSVRMSGGSAHKCLNAVCPQGQVVF